MTADQLKNIADKANTDEDVYNRIIKSFIDIASEGGYEYHIPDHKVNEEIQNRLKTAGFFLKSTKWGYNTNLCISCKPFENI